MPERTLPIRVLMVALVCLTAPAYAKSNSDYRVVVRAYADAMIEHGRDVYGEEHSPLFAAALDRTTMRLGSRESFGSVPGVREHDRSLNGANPQDHLPLYAVLYELTELTGEKKYASEADQALEFFFARCQSPETGLMAWGEHLYWDFHKEACGGNDMHEIDGEWPFWDACYRLAPRASWRFAIGQWDHQVACQQTGDFSRHARWSKHGPGSGFDFPRYAGQMIVNWADAYARKENAERDRREELITAIAVVTGRMEANMKLTESGYLPAGRAEAGSHIDVVWLGSNLELARCLWKAARRIEEEQEELAARMRRLALEQDAAFHQAPHEVASGGGFAATLDATTGKPRTRGSNRPYTAVWATGYGHGMHAGTANRCHARYQQLANSHPKWAAKYRTLVLAAAEQYLSATPATDQLQKPGALANAIELMLHAYDLTEDTEYLDRADDFARLGIGLFLDDDVPLPKATNRHSHYEALTGGPAFMHALLRVATSGRRAGGAADGPVEDAFQAENILALADKVYTHTLKNPYRATDRNWIRATFYSGVMELYHTTGNAKYREQASRWAAKHAWRVGTEGSGMNKLFCAMTWAELYLLDPDPKKLEPTLEWLATDAPNSPGGAKIWFGHAGAPYDRPLYSDSLYGAPLFPMLYRATGEREYLDMLNHVFWTVTDATLDEEEALYYRDPRYIGQKSPHGKKVLWSRGNGWVFASLPRIFRYLPDDAPQREQFVELYRRMAASLAARQQPDGFWRSNLDDPLHTPMPESSGTAYFIAGYAWGVRHGMLDRKTYLPVILRGWKALAGAVHPDGKLGWVQPVGAAPARSRASGTHEYAAGLMLSAAGQVYRLVKEGVITPEAIEAAKPFTAQPGRPTMEPE